MWFYGNIVHVFSSIIYTTLFLVLCVGGRVEGGIFSFHTIYFRHLICLTPYENVGKPLLLLRSFIALHYKLLIIVDPNDHQ